MINKKIGAPFVPKVKSEIDVSNFDPEFTECPVESCSDASMKSDEGKLYFGNIMVISRFFFLRK